MLVKRIFGRLLPKTLILFVAVTIIAIWLAISTEWYFLAALPAVLLLAAVSLADYSKIFYLLLFCIPVSTELVLPNGFGTDLPTEPLIIGLMGIFLYQIAKYPKFVKLQFFKHPISIFILLHLAWIALTTITASDPFVSVKFLLAKTWYVLVFYYLAGSLLRTKKSLATAFWCVLIPLLFTVLVINIRHASYGFSFESIYQVLHPFYRNHVAYACIIAVMIPFVFFALTWYKEQKGKRYFLLAAFVFLLFSLYLSYTRAAYIAVIMAAILYFVIKLRAIRYVLLLAFGLSAVGIVFLANQNQYLEYAPDYDKTISHTEFDDLIAATYNLEDISLMERFYRWVSGFFMIKEKPLLGFGGGNFYNYYKPYTVNSFRTYVSDNPEKSGIHNYYLMIAVEQGLIGLFIFIGLICVALLKAEQAYHRSRNALRKSWIMATTLSFFSILVVLIINDLIETDKIGSFFFLTLAVLVNLDLMSKEQKEA
ncbi:MAG: O-antigen ligase family protein [Bacteroidota bacterium]